MDLKLLGSTTKKIHVSRFLYLKIKINPEINVPAFERRESIEHPFHGFVN